MYRVLIAEDEFFIRLGIKNSVAWRQYDMEVLDDVSNGCEAWKVIRHNCPDILITDLIMPEMNGEHLIQQILDADLNIYIIVITCLEEFKTLQKMLSFGVKDYLLKATMTAQDIEASILKAQQFLNKHRLPAEVNNAVKSTSLPQQIYSYLQDSSLYSHTRQLLTQTGVIPERKAIMVLGIIEHIGNSESPHIYDQIFQNLSSLVKKYERSDTQSICIPLAAPFFLWIIFSCSSVDISCRIPESSIRTIQNELQDYLNISFSLLADTVECVSQLPACYEHLLTLAKRHYLHGSSTILFCPNDNEPTIREIVAPLAASFEWVGNIYGASSLFRFQNSYDEIIKNAGNSKEEMIVSLLKFSDQIKSVFNKLPIQKQCKQCEHDIISSPYLQDCILSLIKLLEICQFHSELPESPHRPEIRNALYYIHKHLKDYDLSLSIVANHVGLSESYFSALFHDTMKQSFRQYLVYSRIEKAKYLLENTDYKISVISQQAGFSDESYFSRTFKKVTNISPKDWRKL